MGTYTPLPVLSGRTPGETLQGYGLRVLGFVVAYGCTATLSLDDLRLADHVYPIAVSRHDLDPRVVDTLSDTRRLILNAIKWLEVPTPIVPPAGSDDVPHVVPTDHHGGSHDRLIPKPKPRTPTGTAVNFAF